PGGMGDVAGHARDVAVAHGELGIERVAVVGMSLGGLVALSIASTTPGLVDRLGMIDITPGLTPEKLGHITAFVNGPRSFASLGELAAPRRAAQRAAARRRQLGVAAPGLRSL